jgi:beta-phosphoglucomutase-like phosphatase (HAD superfamily)
VGVVAAVKAGMPAIGFVGGGHASSALRERLLQAGASVVLDDMMLVERHILASRNWV